MSYTSKLKRVAHFKIKIKGKYEAFVWHWEEPSKQIFGKISFCIHALFGIKKEHNKLLKEQEPGKPEYSKSGWRHVIYKLKLFLHRFFFKWRTIFNVSQFLLFPPLRTRHPIHIQLNPIYPSDHWSSRTRSIYQAPDFIHCSCWVMKSAKHKNHLNSNFVVDRKSKCTDANFQVVFFLFFLQMTKIKKKQRKRLSFNPLVWIFAKCWDSL